ncbi:PucR family transcriptional regulator [Pseudonocardia sp. CA-107938]|uniref:PucR family transcriptional regulator n=1 Tax=Pseudonocardia sp. CA-107938 TaxID=3240021 RepID=UPI003D8F86A8
MTEPLRLGGVPIDVLLARDRPGLVRTLLDAVRAAIPEYELLPAEAMTSDVTSAIENALRLFIETLRSARFPDDDELAVLRESAARRAEEGIPVASVLAAYHLGVEVVWDHVTRDVTPADIADLMTVNRLMLRYLRLVSAAVSAGYVEERQIMLGDEHASRHALLTALLDGGPVEDAASLAGIPLPPAYQVLSMAIGPHPDEHAAGVDAAVAARRKLRRLRAELDRRAHEPVLVALSESGGVALLPVAVEVDELTPAHDRELAATVHALGRAARADLTVAVVAAAPAGVAAAATLAGEVLDVVLGLGRPPGLYQLDDVLMEFHLSRPSAASPKLAARLGPLDERPELLETLTCFLRTGQNRRQTASELHLHPNTVDYRLRRVAALTGLDPTLPRHTIMIETALAARRPSRS